MAMLYRAGHQYTEIARLAGISKARVHQLVSPLLTPEEREQIGRTNHMISMETRFDD